MKGKMILSILVISCFLTGPGCSKKEDVSQNQTKDQTRFSQKRYRDTKTESAGNNRSQNLKRAVSLNDLKKKKGNVGKRTEEKKRAAQPGGLKPMIRQGESMRPFKATTFDGKTISLEEYKGKVVLMDFWATWCRPCLGEVPHLSKLAKEYKDSKNFAIIGVSLDRDKQRLADFIEKNHLDYPHIFDGNGWKNKVARLYGVTRIPFTVLIDEKGKVIATGLRGSALVDKIHELVKK